MNPFGSVHEAPAPAVAVEIAADHIAGATLEWRGGQPVVGSYAIEPLASGALIPSLTNLNTQNRATVAGTLTRVLERIGKPKRVGLIVPDVVAKVSLVKFEKVPPRAQDLEQLIRWQVRKTAPFPIEEAQVAFVPGLAASDGVEFVVALSRRSIIEEYEALCQDAGAHAGLVDLSTFNVVNAVLAGASAPTADWLVINVAADSSSIAIMRGAHMIFFRNRAADAEGSLVDLVHQSAMYYEDRLQGAGLTRVIVAGIGSVEGEQTRRELEQRLATTVTPIDPRSAAALTDRIAAAPALLDTLAPLVGLLLRDRDVVRA
ncbi:MAG TPA: pilus assembly protein PilM [Vicinamibacterales bacterium]|nr:pilus assembly protein PilM [Vicinamibacterales bacterium]